MRKSSAIELPPRASDVRAAMRLTSAAARKSSAIELPPRASAVRAALRLTSDAALREPTHMERRHQRRRARRWMSALQQDQQLAIGTYSQDASRDSVGDAPLPPRASAVARAVRPLDDDPLEPIPIS